MIENNKLIGEFMGLSVVNETEFTNHLREMRSNGIFYTPKHYLDSELQYDTDWNLLMPVVGKCLVGEADHETEDYFDIIEPIYEALCNINIKETFNSVVKFIKWYNENNIKDEKENSI